MAKRHLGLPRASSRIISKNELLRKLQRVDSESERRERVLRLENAFRRKIDSHILSLPAKDAQFRKFNTSPYVILIHARQKNYTKVSELESDILPAKQFSSMETSAGRMVEQVILPEYGWSCVTSKMHTTNSALDGKKLENNIYQLVTLKSGPRCLNDEMSENFADAIIHNYVNWAQESGVQHIDFSYGVLYGTQKQSNKKDWHILRNIKDKIPHLVTVAPENRWNCQFQENGLIVNVTVRVGLDWWNHLGDEFCFVEVFTALIRACINAGVSDSKSYQYIISDLKDIVSTTSIKEDFNVSLLQRSQIPWLLLMAYHFCDELVE